MMSQGFSEASLRCPMGSKKTTPDGIEPSGADAPLAHRRPGYPLSGCVPAEPDSVSPDDSTIPLSERMFQPPKQTDRR
jgi:hypothetical protein